MKRLHAELDGQTVSAQLRRLLIPRLEQGAPSVKAAARELGMSARTLQRRLATENTSYADVVDVLRREIAEEQLREGGATLAEIAYVTGYSEVSTFQRAFKRWTHRTPSQYRQAQ